MKNLSAPTTNRPGGFEYRTVDLTTRTGEATVARMLRNGWQVVLGYTTLRSAQLERPKPTAA